MREFILAQHGYLEIGAPDKNFAYLNAILLNKYGVIVSKPQFLNADNIQIIDRLFGSKIPDSFYKNPQDLRYFCAEELLIEQFISYLTVAINGENSLNAEVFKRQKVFDKLLPNYKEGEEIKLRTYQMATKEECDEVLKELLVSYCKYTRPWSINERDEVRWLYVNGFYENEPLLCRDNAIEMFLYTKNSVFAKMLDKKDIVKMSLQKFGERRYLNNFNEDKVLFDYAIKYVNDCPLSLKQAKYYNTILKKLGIKDREDNSKSPYKKAINLLKSGDVLGAACVFAENGSLLERNLAFLLSRAEINEADEIIDMIKSENPIVLAQIILGVISNDYNKPRTFCFTKDNLVKSHTETEEEFKYRKSILSPEIKNHLNDEILKKIEVYYSKLPSLGRIYVGEEFKKVALPLNTSASGRGLGVAPTGSRLPITCDYVRAFFYWNDAFDIDASVLFIDKKDEVIISSWYNFSKKLFGNSALSSGDCRDKNGAEFYDFKINELKKCGYKKAVYLINGYGSMLNSGEIYCGYQNKQNLNTKAWDAKNIELKIQVVGDSRSCAAFALDFETNEVVILNLMLNDFDRVASANSLGIIEPYLNKEFLNLFNMYQILGFRGEMIAEPNDADVVFDDNYQSGTGQQVIRSTDIEKLVTLLK